jgi:hypothetical protein
VVLGISIAYILEESMTKEKERRLGFLVSH